MNKNYVFFVFLAAALVGTPVIGQQAEPLAAQGLKPLDSLWFAPAIFLTGKPAADDTILNAMQPWQQNKVMDILALRCFPPTFFERRIP
jgi:hypothetical protein